MDRLRHWWQRYLRWRNDVEIVPAESPPVTIRKADISDRDLNKQRLGLSQPPSGMG